MRIVIIGSGNVATVLGRLLKKAGHEIVQVVSRTADHSKALADELHCDAANGSGKLNMDTDVFLVAVKDSALYELNKIFHAGNKLVVHTAGSVSKDVLKELSYNYGVLYPVQSLRKEMDIKTQIPFLVDGNTPETTALIEDLAKTISDTVSVAGDEERLKLHVAAVIVSNFTNHLYAMAEDFCKKENVDFKLLVPLIIETAVRTEKHSPATVQTGPAIRNDVFTLDKHLRLLNPYPKLKYMYLKLTESIMN